jgi:hypothetical protein
MQHTSIIEVSGKVLSIEKMEKFDGYAIKIEQERDYQGKKTRHVFVTQMHSKELEKFDIKVGDMIYAKGSIDCPERRKNDGGVFYPQTNRLIHIMKSARKQVNSYQTAQQPMQQTIDNDKDDDIPF